MQHESYHYHYSCRYSEVYFFFKQKTAYDMRISDWSSDVCSSDLLRVKADRIRGAARRQVDERYPPGIADLPPPDRRRLAAVERDHPKRGEARDQFGKVMRLGLADVTVAARAPLGAADHVPQADARCGEQIGRAHV